MEKSGVEILGHNNTKIEAWGKKKRRGDTEIQNNGGDFEIPKIRKKLAQYGHLSVTD